MTQSKSAPSLGSHLHLRAQSSAHGSQVHDADAPDEGADPQKDIRAQNPGEQTSEDIAKDSKPDDPHKVEKLAKAGDPDRDPDAGSD